MPKSRTRAEAVAQFRQPFDSALRCITHGTLVSSRKHRYELDEAYFLTVNHGDPLRLNSQLPVNLFLSLGCIYSLVADTTPESFRVQLREYWYQFTLADDREILTFHWTPFATGNQRRYPHLHIGQAVLAETSPILPGLFHKRHIPTGQLTIGEITRFAIEELEVQPVIENWRDALDASIQAEATQ